MMPATNAIAVDPSVTIIGCYFGWLRHLASSKNATRMMPSIFYQDTHNNDSALFDLESRPQLMAFR